MFLSKQRRGYHKSFDLDNLENADEGAVAESPFAEQTVLHKYLSTAETNAVSVNMAAAQQLRDTFHNGSDFDRLISLRPSGVIDALRSYAVVRTGVFTSIDSKVYDAFDRNFMLTRGMDAIEDTNYATSWRMLIEERSLNRRTGLFQKNEGWNEEINLAAYCVTIKNAAAPSSRGVLYPLLRKERRGTAGDDVWDFPAVQAVIQYKWSHWARKYLFVEFMLYLGWVITFALYLVIYIENNLDKSFDDMNAEEMALALFAYACDIASIIFMLPFLVIEFNSIKYYKWRWLNMWNLIDAFAYMLQVLVTFFHFTHIIFRNKRYNTLLAIQCAILFIKVQYFSRVMGVGASYVETLRTLLHNVRYFLLFIVLNMISAALSFAVLYKEDVSEAHRRMKEGEEFNESFEDFGSVPRSLVTTYAVLLGSFESSYVFHTENEVVKGMFFLLFQLFMSITVLNLLIAVMTESYTSIRAKERVMYNRGRAELIDELEATLPQFLLPEYKPFIHFIVVEKQKPVTHELSATKSEDPYGQLGIETRDQLNKLQKMIERLQKNVEKLQEGKVGEAM